MLNEVKSKMQSRSVNKSARKKKKLMPYIYVSEGIVVFQPEKNSRKNDCHKLIDVAT